MDCPTQPFRGGLDRAWARGDASDLPARARACSSQARYLERPYHLLVPSSVKRRSTAEVVYHSLGRFPSGALRQLAPGEFVVSPECCLMQMARSMEMLELVKLGYEFCGRYSFDRQGACLFDERDPLTDPVRLGRFAARMEGAYGIRHLTRALPHIIGNSFSPAETATAMLLSLPHRYGGFAIERPLLNHRIDPGARHQASVGKAYYLCDLFWPEAQVAVEYDSDLCHTGPERIARDALRRIDLTRLGVTVLTLTKGQLYDPWAFARFAGTLARSLGGQLRVRCGGFEERHRLLRATVLSGSGAIRR